ncbi:MAG: hypothetical protein ACI9SC_001686 [Gammaproteobacteria bacterium]|jgi:hypothetical protein
MGVVRTTSLETEGKGIYSGCSGLTMVRKGIYTFYVYLILKWIKNETIISYNNVIFLIGM